MKENIIKSIEICQKERDMRIQVFKNKPEYQKKKVDEINYVIRTLEYFLTK